MDKKPEFKWDGNFIRFCELFFDALIVMGSIFIVHSIRTLGDDKYNITSIFELFFNLNIYFSLTQTIVSNILYLIVTLFFLIVYKASVINKSYGEAMVSIVISLVFSTFAYIIINFFFDVKYLGALTSLGLFIVQIFFFAIYKYILYRILLSKNIKTVLIVGPKKDMEKYLVKFLNYLPENRILKYIVYEDTTDIEKVYKYIDNVDMVYILPDVDEVNKNKLMGYCIANKQIDICLIPQIYEVAITGAHLENIDDVMVYKINSLHLSLEERFFKRIFDILFAIILIVLTLWLMIIIAIIIRISDGGAAIYKQERVTINGKTFKLYKFRTMRMDAEKYTGAIWSVKNDPRITKVGKVLRAFRLDELPQLFNILNGDMSVVGPRPERPMFVEEFRKENPEFIYRLNVKAGLTGYAQIYGKYNTSPADKIRYDLYYIRNYSFFLDIKLLLLTIRTLFDKTSTRGVEEDNDLEAILKKFVKVEVIKIKD